MAKRPLTEAELNELVEDFLLDENFESADFLSLEDENGTKHKMPLNSDVSSDPANWC